MTLASAIIADAYRESNLVALVSSPSTLEQTEGLNRLNPLILSCVGNEAGQELRDLNIGGQFERQIGEWVPHNARLVLNLAAAKTLKLHPRPHEGQRLAIIDAGGNLATRNLTLNANGRLIEGSATLVLNANGMGRQWMYRADTGNWAKISALAASDQMPFPQEFDDFFVTALAMRLNPRHSASMTKESLAVMERQRQQMRARYRRPRPPQDMGTLGLLGQQNWDSGNASLLR